MLRATATMAIFIMNEEKFRCEELDISRAIKRSKFIARAKDRTLTDGLYLVNHTVKSDIQKTKETRIKSSDLHTQSCHLNTFA